MADDQMPDEADSQPAEATTAEDEKELEGSQPQTQEELEWSTLKGSTQDRVRDIINQRNEARLEANELRRKFEEVQATRPTEQPYQQALSPEEITEEQKKAVQTLRQYGIVTKEDLEQVTDWLTLENEYRRLEDVYSGQDGRPRFLKEEVEDHMMKSGIYNPEKAYNDLYYDELYDWRKKNEGVSPKKGTYTEKPISPTRSRGKPLSVDMIREKLSNPGGKEWWDKNREKVLPMMSDLLKE